jgi:serine/threonine protein kinase
MDAVEKLKASLADRYKVQREIGVGGMATVYLAKDLRHDRGGEEVKSGVTLRERESHRLSHR